MAPKHTFGGCTFGVGLLWILDPCGYPAPTAQVWSCLFGGNVQQGRAGTKIAERGTIDKLSPEAAVRVYCTIESKGAGIKARGSVACMHVCTYVCMYVCMYVYIKLCICIICGSR